MTHYSPSATCIHTSTGVAASTNSQTTTQVVGQPHFTISVNIEDIKVDDDRRPLGDISGLVSSIQTSGLLHPITITQDHTLVAGTRRIAAYRALGLGQIPAHVITCQKLEAELAAIDENLMRNELSAIEQGEYLTRREQVLTALGRRAPSGRPKKGAVASPLETTASIAEQIGLHPRVAQQRKSLIKKLSPELRNMIRHTSLASRVSELEQLACLEAGRQVKVAAAMLAGEAKTVHEVLENERKAERAADIQRQKDDIAQGTAQLPPGKFQVIAMDPPWPISDAKCPYPTMSLEEIAALKIPADDDCILFLWTIHQFLLRDTALLLDKWGFRPVSTITWVKTGDAENPESRPHLGHGTWLRSQSEYCIMAVKGDPHRFIDLHNQSTVLYGPRRKHSQKPDSFFEMVDGLCMGRKLDYFSRQTRPGWESFGNETTLFDEPCPSSCSTSAPDPAVEQGQDNPAGQDNPGQPNLTLLPTVAQDGTGRDALEKAA